jgi:hypothetical protein
MRSLLIRTIPSSALPSCLVATIKGNHVVRGEEDTQDSGREYTRRMVSKLHLAQLLACCFSFILPATAQLDSAAMRMKYGTPLNRETFHMPAGFDLVVDYGASNQVCKLYVPAWW